MSVGRRSLKRWGQGRPVSTATLSARQPTPTIVLSNAMRSAVTSLSKTLSRELAADRITFNCLAPDNILTDRTRTLALAAGRDPDEAIKQDAANAPMRRLGAPSEFGAACAFLCSKQAGYITGQTIGVDGGSLLGVY